MTDTDDFPFYKEHPKTCAPDDFWGQVKRSVNGQPVSEEQIAMIESAILQGLNVQTNDRLLDLCCGNGALTERILNHCSDGVGVDFSPALIEVAHKYFQRPPNRAYVLDDVVRFTQTAEAPEKFTKALCYGSFMFLPEASARALLEALCRRFPNIERVFIGNLPDLAVISEFSQGRKVEPDQERDPASPIGVWRTEAEFSELANSTGWAVEYRRMPPAFYASRYRYDAILTRGST